MMKRVKIILFILGLMISASALHAQGFGGGKPDPKKMAEDQTNWMSENLTLTADQETKVSELNLKYANKLDELFQQSGGPPSSETRTKIENLEKEKEAELKPLLSKEQWEKYQKNKKKLRRGPPSR